MVTIGYNFRPDLFESRKYVLGCFITGKNFPTSSNPSGDWFVFVSEKRWERRFYTF